MAKTRQTDTGVLEKLQERLITPDVGTTPAIVLTNPKFGRNLSATLRACSCFGVKQMWWTGDRVQFDETKKGQRLPREERMKGYSNVELCHGEYFFDAFTDAVPVAVEFRPNSELLPEFEHPENAVYIFGPEDGTIGRKTLQHCHRFLTIPSHHCLNLAAAVYVTLYDRVSKLGLPEAELSGTPASGDIIIPEITGVEGEIGSVIG